MFSGKRIYKSLPHEKTPRAGFFHELTSCFLMVTWNDLKDQAVGCSHSEKLFQYQNSYFFSSFLMPLINKNS
jgi:hypothetical protein